MKLCGRCLNGEQCDHVDGSCPNGCGKGAYGDKCDKGLGNVHMVSCICNRTTCVCSVNLRPDLDITDQFVKYVKNVLMKNFLYSVVLLFMTKASLKLENLIWGLIAFMFALLEL